MSMEPNAAPPITTNSAGWKSTRTCPPAMRYPPKTAPMTARMPRIATMREGSTRFLRILSGVGCVGASAIRPRDAGRLAGGCHVPRCRFGRCVVAPRARLPRPPGDRAAFRGSVRPVRPFPGAGERPELGHQSLDVGGPRRLREVPIEARLDRAALILFLAPSG